jgi:precorrin-6A/cobalt-precorrin-6A reductase
MAETARLLILGGTTEAASLAAAAARQMGELRVITSLAGRTTAPAKLAGEVRTGGFGGTARLEDYLRAEAIDLVIDATHPFAAVISANAAAACDGAGVQRLQLCRPAWARQPGDAWIEVADIAAAAAKLPATGDRAFLTVGRGDLDCFAPIRGTWFLIRTIEKPDVAAMPPSSVAIQGRGPFDEQSERALMAKHRIDVVIAKNSGGAATYGKIAAARTANIPVIMVRRPPGTPGERVATVDAATDWLKGRLRGTGEGVGWTPDQARGDNL